MKIAAIVLAGGSGTRMGTGTNKPYLRVRGRPLLWYSLDSFRRAGAEPIVVVTRTEDHDRLSESDIGEVCVVEGGATRTDSEHAGIAALGAADVDIIMIHDAARPFLTVNMIRHLAEATNRVGGAVPGLSFPTAPWHRGDGPLEQIEDEIMRVQTPQSFAADSLRPAYRRAAADQAVAADTAEIMERYGDCDVAVIDGDPDLFKVTFQADLERVEAAAGRWWQDRTNDRN